MGFGLEIDIPKLWRYPELIPCNTKDTYFKQVLHIKNLTHSIDIWYTDRQTYWRSGVKCSESTQPDYAFFVWVFRGLCLVAIGGVRQVACGFVKFWVSFWFLHCQFKTGKMQ